MFVKAEFNEKTNADHYSAHLADLTKWHHRTPTVVDNICKKLFTHAQYILSFRLAAVRFSLGSGTFWLNLNLKYQVWSSRQLNPEPEPLEPGLKGLNSV